MANAHDYRRRLGTILRVEEITNMIKESMAWLSTGYRSLQGKEHLLLVYMEYPVVSEINFVLQSRSHWSVESYAVQ